MSISQKTVYTQKHSTFNIGNINFWEKMQHSYLHSSIMYHMRQPSYQIVWILREKQMNRAIDAIEKQVAYICSSSFPQRRIRKKQVL